MFVRDVNTHTHMKKEQKTNKKRNQKKPHTHIHIHTHTHTCLVEDVCDPRCKDKGDASGNCVAHVREERGGDEVHARVRRAAAAVHPLARINNTHPLVTHERQNLHKHTHTNVKCKWEM
jgi:hypothetical protein